MFSQNMPQTLQRLFKGNKNERIHAFASLFMWFAAGGFTFLVLSSYLDKYFAADLSSPEYAFTAGILAAIISTIKAA